MRDTWTAAKVGLLVVVGIIASVLVYRFVDERAGGRGGYELWAAFDDAQGLVPKSRVVVAGIPVGYIRSIRLWEAKARIDVHLDEGVVLHDDAWITKRSASLLGESLLVIHPGSATRPALRPGERIPVLEGAPTTDQILQTVAETARSLQSVAAQIERAFGTDEGGRQMASALANLTAALEGANRMISQNEDVIGRTLRNVESATGTAGPQLVRILEHIETVTRDVRQIVSNNRDRIDAAGGEAAETIASIHRASLALEQVLADVRVVTERTARGEGALGRLLANDDLVDEVESVAEGVGDFVGTYARLQTIVGLQSEYNFLANTFKNYVSIRLQPREDRYYLFQLINDPRGLTEFTQTTVRRSPPAEGEPPFYQETRIETRDAFRFSLMFAKRIHFATFRFGILESTGGLGTDLHLFDDALELNLDVFAVGEQAFPRLRARLAYEIVQRLWLLGGVDDALNESSDFFLGAMLRFNDEDLKSILPFAGGVAPTGHN